VRDCDRPYARVLEALIVVEFFFLSFQSNPCLPSHQSRDLVIKMQRKMRSSRMKKRKIYARYNIRVPFIALPLLEKNYVDCTRDGGERIPYYLLSHYKLSQKKKRKVSVRNG
jgi:aromatic ring-opening dioxygenase LigB subunit